jgi:hypothetical protein
MRKAMRRSLIALALLAPLLAPLPALAQKTPVAPIEKGTALPPPETDEAAVLAPINALFAALTARDGQAMLAHVLPEGHVAAAGNRPDGSPVITHHSWAEFAAGIKPGPEAFEERLYNPAIEIDGDIAMVWGRYDFRINGKVSHCGVDHFDLLRTGGQWKILNIIWSRRTTDCPAG